MTMALSDTPKSIASLMRISLDRRSSIEKAHFQLAPKQIQTMLVNFYQNNDEKEYFDILVKLRTFNISDENFKVLLEDCCACVCFLGRNASDFVISFCQISWANRSIDLIQLYEQFILNLVTAQIYHTPTVFASVLSLFKKDVEMWEETPSEVHSKRWTACHTLLARILKAIPLSKDVLTRCILEQYPYHRADSASHRAYVYNLFQMMKYLPEITEQIIAIIINRMAILDVNIDANHTYSGDSYLFEMEVDNYSNDMMDTMDYCMVEILQWIEKERVTAVYTIFNIFEKVILPTYGTRYVQFLLFYAVSINQNCGERTLSMLWSVASGHHAHGLSANSLRCAAAVHLSGLIARASQIPRARLMHYLKLGTDWCHNYITVTQDCFTSHADLAKAHSAFYAICEAIFYLIAFKHRQLFDDGKALTFVESLNLPRLVTCTLNPLRFCSLHIASVFAAVTRSYQIVYCHALLERNARHNFVSSMTIHNNQWFPYDPYPLPRSGKWIWPLYAEYEEWSDSRETEAVEPRARLKDGDEDDFLATSPAVKVSSSFSKMFLPGFKHDTT